MTEGDGDGDDADGNARGRCAMMMPARMLLPVLCYEPMKLRLLPMLTMLATAMRDGGG